MVNGRNICFLLKEKFIIHFKQTER